MMPPEEGCQGKSLTQRGACSGTSASETSQNSRWLDQSPLSGPDSSVSRLVRKKLVMFRSAYICLSMFAEGFYLYHLVYASTVLAMKIRALDWGINLDLTALQSGCEAVKEACALLRQVRARGAEAPLAPEALKLVSLLESLIKT